MRSRRRNHLIAAPYGGNNFKIILELEQCSQRGADQLLVVGQQQSDHAGAPISVPRRNAQPPALGLNGAGVDEAPRRRWPVGADRRGPLRPRDVPPTPSSTISTDDVDSLTAQELA
jgi:hypothetical protein